MENDEELRDLAYSGLNSLSASLRVPLVMATMEDLTREEVATFLGSACEPSRRGSSGRRLRCSPTTNGAASASAR